VRLARRGTYPVLWASLVLLLAVAVSGCQTTQDTAAKKQAEAKRILEKRAQKHRSQAHEHKGGKR
jgi:hypothetical protein